MFALPKYVQRIRIQDYEVHGDLLSKYSMLVEVPMLPDYEISLLRLLEKVTNGTVIEISVTGAITHFDFMNNLITSMLFA
jgi:hypothetical protein